MEGNNEVFLLAKPYLKKGLKKNFVLHTEGVVRAMKLLIKSETKEKQDILIMVAILHDVGWAKVPKEIQKSQKDKDNIIGLKLHIKYAPEIIRKILIKAGIKKQTIKYIIELVVSHKFKNPKNKYKRFLIDADALSDSFKKQFYEDIKKYKITAKQNYYYRLKTNKFYTKAAESLFNKEMLNRKKEIKL